MPRPRRDLPRADVFRGRADGTAGRQGRDQPPPLGGCARGAASRPRPGRPLGDDRASAIPARPYWRTPPRDGGGRPLARADGFRDATRPQPLAAGFDFVESTRTRLPAAHLFPRSPTGARRAYGGTFAGRKRFILDGGARSCAPNGPDRAVFYRATGRTIPRAGSTLDERSRSRGIAEGAGRPDVDRTAPRAASHGRRPEDAGSPRAAPPGAIRSILAAACAARPTSRRWLWAIVRPAPGEGDYLQARRTADLIRVDREVEPDP